MLLTDAIWDAAAGKDSGVCLCRGTALFGVRQRGNTVSCVCVAGQRYLGCGSGEMQVKCRVAVSRDSAIWGAAAGKDSVCVDIFGSGSLLHRRLHESYVLSTLSTTNCACQNY